METTHDILLAAGQFLGIENNVVDISVSAGERSDPGTHRQIGHYIIDIFNGEAVRVEVPVGSRHVRHPSVTNGIREAWSITVDDLVIGFSPTQAEQPLATISSLAIGGTKLSPICSDDSIRL